MDKLKYGKSRVNKMEHLWHLHCVYFPQEFVETLLFGVPEEGVLGLPSSASLLIIQLLLSSDSRDSERSDLFCW